MRITEGSGNQTNFDLACAVSFDPTVLNVVAIRPYIVYNCAFAAYFAKKLTADGGLSV